MQNKLETQQKILSSMPATKEKVISVADKIIKQFKEHQEIVDAILKSETFTEDAEVEIQAAVDALQEDIIHFDDNKDFENIYKKLKDLSDKSELTDEDNVQLLNLIEEYDITNYLESKGYSFIKIASADHQAKLTEFLTTEIFPFYNEQKSAITNLF
jgi:predicted component of type VI protein secretion system